ncbi:hypothetical protein HNP81_002857 [Peribacillus huizhouensis]|uniref:Glycosyltransferase n=1 Tax=Peribacillus huizhouensis TaxID=1501239 RepID=A0ABR6CT90_9BACI|nr:hypothetical protein [Peribacillus huizhouensis]
MLTTLIFGTIMQIGLLAVMFSEEITQVIRKWRG